MVPPFHYDGVCPVDDCALKVDIYIVSGDSFTLGAHSSNLALFNNGFPQRPFCDGNMIQLEEDAKLLRLLLRFVHNTRQPDLGLIPISQLRSLAEAAEKYQIYSAMGSCKNQMGHFTSKSPITVWVYAVKYDYPTLADEAANFTLNSSPTQLMLRATKDKLKDTSVIQWQRYREQWSNILSSLVFNRGGSCEHWERFQFNVTIDIGKRLASLTNFENIAKSHKGILQRNCCSSRFDSWSSNILGNIKALKKYSECL